MKQILIVEDDSFLNKMLDYNLTAAMNNFIASMNVFSKGFCIFTTDLRAERHSNWYCIQSKRFERDSEIPRNSDFNKVQETKLSF